MNEQVMCSIYWMEVSSIEQGRVTYVVQVCCCNQEPTVFFIEGFSYFSRSLDHAYGMEPSLAKWR